MERITPGLRYPVVNPCLTFSTLTPEQLLALFNIAWVQITWITIPSVMKCEFSAMIYMWKVPNQRTSMLSLLPTQLEIFPPTFCWRSAPWEKIFRPQFTWSWALISDMLDNLQTISNPTYSILILSQRTLLTRLTCSLSPMVFTDQYHWKSINTFLCNPKCAVPMDRRVKTSKVAEVEGFKTYHWSLFLPRKYFISKYASPMIDLFHKKMCAHPINQSWFITLYCLPFCILTWNN